MLRLLFLLLLATILASACADDLILMVEGDPIPDIQTGESLKKSSLSKYCSDCTIAEFDLATGRLPIPNEVVLKLASKAMPGSSSFKLAGIDPLTPVRIPFDGSIKLDFDQNWAKGLLIINPNDPTDKVFPWPSTEEIAGETGSFKTLYQDAANDLILVPLKETFKAGQEYIFLVTNHLKDSKGKKLESSVAFSLLKHSEPFVTNFKVNPKWPLLGSMPIADVFVLEMVREALAPTFYHAAKKVALNELIMVFSYTITGKDKKQPTDMNLLHQSLMQVVKTIFPTFGSSLKGTAHTPISLSYFSEDENAPLISKTWNPNSNNNNEFGLSQLDQDLALEEEFDFVPYFQGEKDWPAGINSNVAEYLESAWKDEDIYVDKLYLGHLPCLNFLSNKQKLEGVRQNENNNGNLNRNDNENNNLSIRTQKPADWQFDFVNRIGNPQNDCPKLAADLSKFRLSKKGHLDFWLSIPKTLDKENPRVAIIQHGLGGMRHQILLVANRLASRGVAAIAIDGVFHGDRQEAKKDGSVSWAGSFLRVDNPSLTAGYLLQNKLDLANLSYLLKTNPVLLSLLGVTDKGKETLNKIKEDPTKSLEVLKSSSPQLYYIGGSLGGIFGILINSDGKLPFERMVLNVPGGDLADIIMNASFGREPSGRAESSADMNPLVQVISEMMSAHILSSLRVEPLNWTNEDFPADFLMQQILGDKVIPASNTELLIESLGAKENIFKDGSGDILSDVPKRSLWVFDPSNYAPLREGGQAAHGFLNDGQTTATCAGQMQTIEYLITGKILDPVGDEIISRCEN